MVKDGAKGGTTLTRLHIEDARFTVPGDTGRVQIELTVTLDFESDGGERVVVKA